MDKIQKIKIKIISAYNESFKEISDLSFSTVESFCQNKSIPYERFYVREFDKPMAWFKIKALIDEIKLNQYDYILWIDADAMVLDKNFDIESIIDHSKTLHIAKDFNNINSGVMIWKVCELSSYLLEQIWLMSEKYLHHIWWEQAAIIELYEKNIGNILENTSFVKQSTLNAYETRYYGPLREEGEINEKSFICHFPSLPVNTRINLIKKYIKS
jgi:hypothetical protein